MSVNFSSRLASTHLYSFVYLGIGNFEFYFLTSNLSFHSQFPSPTEEKREEFNDSYLQRPSQVFDTFRLVFWIMLYINWYKLRWIRLYTIVIIIQLYTMWLFVKYMIVLGSIENMNFLLLYFVPLFFFSHFPRKGNLYISKEILFK